MQAAVDETIFRSLTHPRINFRVMDVRYDRGVYLPENDLWLDPWDAKPFAFVSHAHSDHIAPHDEIIVSEGTARLMQARLPGKRKEHILPFGEQRRVHDVDLMLLPAGHIFPHKFFSGPKTNRCFTPATSNCAAENPPKRQNGCAPTHSLWKRLSGGHITVFHRPTKLSIKSLPSAEKRSAMTECPSCSAIR